MADLVELARLARPINSAMIGFAVIVGVAVASPYALPSLSSLLGFAAGFFISGFSMTVNDYYDLEVDRMNDPRRPLPSGRVSPGEALVFAESLLIAGLVASAFTSPVNLAIALIFACIGWLYSYRGKRRGLPGNMMVASSLAIPFIYGGVLAEAWSSPLVWSLAAIAFLAGTGREVVKTIPDVKGDEVRGVRSVARVHGPRFACFLGAAFFLAAVAASLLPIALRYVGFAYTALILIPDAIFIYASIRIVQNHEAENALFIKKLALIGMMTGLVAFIVGGAFRG